VTGALAASREWAGARVSALYQSVLGRPVDDAGRRHWVASMGTGTTLEEIAVQLYGSTEYHRRSGSTPAGFVEQLFVDILARPADPAGLAHWEAALGRGWSRSGVAAALYDSSESRTSRVAGLYRDVLGRAPDEGGAQHWVGRIRSVDDVTLAATLAASAEFYERVTGTEALPAMRRAQHTAFQPFAVVGELSLHHPASVVDMVGLHQSGQATSKPMTTRPTAVRPTVLPSRGRGTDRRTAADVVVPPGAEIRSPVSGRVVRADHYRLYCKYDDHRVVIEPDGHPGWRLHVLHVADLTVAAGQRVEAGVTPIARSASVFGFASQVEAYSPAPAWPHVHIHVVDAPVGDGPPAAC
jgi:murein DD-endopeptidase MepM/ murein hydrolase activator NlpD